MPDEAEMEILVEALTDSFCNGMIDREGGAINGREAESAQVVGSVAVSVSSDCVSGKDFLQD